MLLRQLVLLSVTATYYQTVQQKERRLLLQTLFFIHYKRFLNLYPSNLSIPHTASFLAYLLFKKHRVDGLAAGKDHHGESDGHRHHEADADHLCYQVGWKVHQHVTCNVLCETDIAKKSHLVQRGVEGSKYRV